MTEGTTTACAPVTSERTRDAQYSGAAGGNAYGRNGKGCASCPNFDRCRAAASFNMTVEPDDNERAT